MKQRLTKQKIIQRATVMAGVIATLVGGLSANTYAAADNAEITITGKVMSTTCTIDSKSATQKVKLPDIVDRDIRGVGTTGGETKFDIILKDCGDAADNVIVTASGKSYSGADDSVFANSLTDGADGVGMYLYQTDGKTKFKPNGNVKETSKLTRLADVTLTYKAAYVGTKDSVRGGDFSTVVNMKFDYP